MRNIQKKIFPSIHHKNSKKPHSWPNFRALSPQKLKKKNFTQFSAFALLQRQAQNQKNSIHQFRENPSTKFFQKRTLKSFITNSPPMRWDQGFNSMQKVGKITWVDF